MALLLGSALVVAAEQRINQEGRVLGPAPVITTAVLFNTPQADEIVAAMQIFPVTNPWNEDISRRPVLMNSDAMIGQIISDLASSRRTARLFYEMNFVLVPDFLPLLPLDLVDYPDESDPSPYPIPWNMPIETWPRETGSLTLQQWQLDLNDDGGDRHAIVVQPGAGFVWEMWQVKLIDPNPTAGIHWQAANGAKFDLKSNTLRPFGWTSGDAAGLAMFPALVRFDECQRGMVEHAMRLVVKRTRVGPIYPATHQASVGNLTNPNIPAMGQRLRLKRDFNIPIDWTTYEKAVLLGLKKYGAIVADNGGFFSISVTPDDRYPANAFAHVESLSLTNFEVIQTTGPTEGPRSPNAPRADAGVDFIAGVGVPAELHGNVTETAGRPSTRWQLYAGPGPAAFADATRTNTTVTFNQPGNYTLRLSADDGLHPVAYAAVAVTVSTNLIAHITPGGFGEIVISWTGGAPPYVLESANSMPATAWVPIATNTTTRATLPLTNRAAFVRVRGD
jgi:hypothetical protein